jgi:hypothetical protein
LIVIGFALPESPKHQSNDNDPYCCFAKRHVAVVKAVARPPAATCPSEPGM